VAWFIAAGGAALLSAGAGTLWVIQNQELTRCHNPPPHGYLPCNNESAVSGRRNLAVGATLGTGAVAITMAVIGMLSGDSDGTAPSARSALSCTVLPSGLLCSKAF